MAPGFSSRVTGLLAIAEDEPSLRNGVSLHPRRVDRFGRPELVVSHRYSRGDLAARRALVSRARSILRDSGAKITFVYPITTFSHAVGTLRMGEDPWAAPLDPGCRFRGTDNLYVVDGSFMPTSGGVNPSLTIAANALRAAEWITRKSRVRGDEDGVGWPQSVQPVGAGALVGKGVHP
jgi:choline dehydrogenase-like flavoprotein